MSPSEDQLRAALRAGEGGSPDPDVIIGHALQVKHVRRQRQVRLVSVAAAVILVGGLGVGLTALNRSGDRGSAGSRADSATMYNDSAGSAVSGTTVPVVPGPASIAVGTGAAAGGAAGGAGTGGGVDPTDACPATPVRYALPGGGGTDQFGAGGSLFSGSVASIVVCRYSSTTDSPLLSAQTFTGTDAQRAASALDAAPSTQSAELFCRTLLTIELIPTGTDGTAMTPISVTGQCTTAMVTNGTAVRYVPLNLYGLAPTPPPTPGQQPVSGAMSGSPPR